MITVINHNLFVDPAAALVHCANCFCRMKSGVAAGMVQFYPEAIEADNKTKPGDRLKLGTFSKAVGQNGKIIYNLYGQFYYGTDSRKVDYEAMYNGLVAVRKDMFLNNIKTIALPYNMGCGLAGGDWKIVNAMIESVFADATVDVSVCKI